MSLIHEPNIHIYSGLDESNARRACHNFGHGWAVSKVAEGALVCTFRGVTWEMNCKPCNEWRMIVWIDGSHDFLEKEKRRIFGNFNWTLSTKAGKYYGGLNPCKPGNNYPLCGDW